MPRTFHVADAVTVALREKQLLSQHHFETFEGGKKMQRRPTIAEAGNGDSAWNREE